MRKKILTPEFRIAFNHLFEAKENLSGNLKYSVTMLFDKEKADLSEIKKIIKETAKDRWGSKLPKDLKSPISDGDEKDYNGFENSWYINASSDFKAGIVDAECQEIIDPSELYAGCYARATINAYAWENMGRKGVSVSVQNIQKIRDCEPEERLDGRSDAASDFEPVGVVASTTSDDADSDDIFA